MARRNETEGSIEEARSFVAGRYLGITHELEGDGAPTGDERTFLLFERTYLEGLVGMAAHLKRGGSIVDLAKMIDKEIRGIRSGRIETGVLHTRPVGLDPEVVGQAGRFMGPPITVDEAERVLPNLF